MKQNCKTMRISRILPSAFHIYDSVKCSKILSLKRFSSGSSKTIKLLKQSRIYDQHEKGWKQLYVNNTESTQSPQDECSYDSEEPENSRSSDAVEIVTIKNLIYSLDKNRNNISFENWQNVENDFNKTVFKKEKLFPFYVLKHCCNNDLYTIGESFFSYLKHKSVEPNIPTLALYISLCGRAALTDKSAEMRCLDAYSQLLNTHGSNFDRFVGRLIINGLSHTSEWKKCLTILDKLCKHRAATSSCYSDIAIAAFRENDDSLAWNLLNSMSGGNIQPGPKLTTYLAARIKDLVCGGDDIAAEDELERYLKLLRSHRLSISEEAALLLQEAFSTWKNFSWRSGLTCVAPTGVCFGCKQRLPDIINITPDDFNHLKHVLVNSVIKGKNIWLKTTPAEFHRFMGEMSRYPKFDFVLDSLNISYVFNYRQRNGHDLARRQLLKVVNTLVSPGKRLLLIGRRHMARQWQLDALLAEFQGCVEVFLTENSSEDDPFTLYAAFESGGGCRVVTNDYFRDAQFLMAPASTLFLRWRYKHQLVVASYQRDGTCRFVRPVYFDPVAQRTHTHVHIPFTGKDEAFKYQLPRNWLCASEAG